MLGRVEKPNCILGRNVKR